MSKKVYIKSEINLIIEVEQDSDIDEFMCELNILGTELTEVINYEIIYSK